jgi:predicted metal-binding protein
MKRNTKTNNQKKLESLFKQFGYTDFKWIRVSDIVVSYWVRMKCLFGCNNYGKNALCPPNIPSIEECQRFFHEYSTGVIFHFQKKLKDPEDRHAWSQKINADLLELEREVFLSGHQKAFLFYMNICKICGECQKRREDCTNPKSARPAPESFGIDVFSTVRKYGYPIEVLSDYSQTMNRYAILLIE